MRRFRPHDRKEDAMTPMDVLIVVERFFLYWLAYSFAGWVWETGLSVVLRKRFEDRGMLNGPICPIYGVCWSSCCCMT